MSEKAEHPANAPQPSADSLLQAIDYAAEAVYVDRAGFNHRLSQTLKVEILRRARELDATRTPPSTTQSAWGAGENAVRALVAKWRSARQDSVDDLGSRSDQSWFRGWNSALWQCMNELEAALAASNPSAADAGDELTGGRK